MRINKGIVFTTAVGLALSSSSCRKFMDVNTNPNVSQTATVQTLLPAAELYVGSSVGVDLQINGSIWAQYWTQTPIASQYITLEQYAPGPDAFSVPWRNLYSAAENFQQLINLSDSLKKKQYKAIAMLMKAYTFQLLTDGWGDVPFRQALKAQYENGHVTNPKYDSQRVVYRGIIGIIDSAQKLINIGDPVHPGGDDLIYGGDMRKWEKFANTLKMKIYLRLAYVDPLTARLGIDSLYNGGAPALIGDGDDAKIAYGFSSANKNPMYAEFSSAQLAGVQNLAGSRTAIDSMNNNDDYRAYVFYEATSAGIPVGIDQASYNISKPAGSYSIPNVYVAGDVNNSNSTNAPVNLLTSWESNFMQAEIAARGWGSPAMTDVAYFYAGIQSSFNYYGNALETEIAVTAHDADSIYVNGDPVNSIPAGYWTQYPTGGSLDDKLRFIITQKWFAMCGNQGFEAWTEWRRTGYPDFLVHPANSLIGSQRPLRFLYPTSESTVNANYPGLAPIMTKVWWDTF